MPVKATYGRTLYGRAGRSSASGFASICIHWTTAASMNSPSAELQTARNHWACPAASSGPPTTTCTAVTSAAPAPSSPGRRLNGGRPASSSFATAKIATIITTGPLSTVSTELRRSSPGSVRYQPTVPAPSSTVVRSSQKQIRWLAERIRIGYVNITVTRPSAPSPTSTVITGPGQSPPGPSSWTNWLR